MRLRDKAKGAERQAKLVRRKGTWVNSEAKRERGTAKSDLDK